MEREDVICDKENDSCLLLCKNSRCASGMQGEIRIILTKVANNSRIRFFIIFKLHEWTERVKEITIFCF